MNRALTMFLIGLVVVLVILALTCFTVDQRQNAIVFRLGEPVHDARDRRLGRTVLIVHDAMRRRSLPGLRRGHRQALADEERDAQ